MLKSVIKPLIIGGIVVSTSFAAQTVAEAQKIINRVKPAVKRELPALFQEYKRNVALFTKEDKVKQYRLIEKEFLSGSGYDGFSNVKEAAELSEQFSMNSRKWHFRSFMKEADLTLVRGELSKEALQNVNGIESKIHSFLKQLRFEVKELRRQNIAKDKYKLDVLEASLNYFELLNKFYLSPVEDGSPAENFSKTVGALVGTAMMNAEERLRPVNDGPNDVPYTSKNGNIYTIQYTKVNVLGERYVHREERYTIPPNHKHAYLTFSGKRIKGSFKLVKQTDRTVGNRIVNIAHYTTRPAYVKAYDIWDKERHKIFGLFNFKSPVDGSSDAAYLTYADNVAKAVGAPTLAQTKPSLEKFDVSAEIKVAFENLQKVAKASGAEETSSAAKKRIYAETMKLKGAVAEPPKGEARSIKINFRKTSGSTIPNKYFTGRKFRLAPESNPEAVYLNQAMKYYQMHVSHFPINQPQTIAITEADGTVLFDTTIVFSPQSSYDNSLDFKIDEKKLMGDGSNEQLTLALRFNNEKGNSLKSTYFKGLQIAVARKKSPNNQYIKKAINFYSFSLNNVFCTDQVISLINAEGATVWSGEVYVDPANVSKGRQDVTFTIAESVFTGESSEPATGSAANNNSSGSAQREESTPQNNTQPAKESAKKKRGSRLKKIGQSLF